jgi:hypothetical protein
VYDVERRHVEEKAEGVSSERRLYEVLVRAGGRGQVVCGLAEGEVGHSELLMERYFACICTM